MTDMDDADGPDTDPIDAQFEPAPPSADHVVTPEKTPRRPGWLALVATGVIATILGAGLGSMTGGSLSGTSATAPADGRDYEAQIAALEADQNKLGARLAALSADLEQAEARLDAEITETAGAADPVENTELADDFAALAARVDLLSALPESEGIDGEDTRAISARLLAFEQTLANLKTGQSTRAEALAALSTRLSELEVNSGEGVDPNALVSLHEDISGLKAQLADAVSGSAERDTLTERLTQLETRQQASQAALTDTHSSGRAALALIALESASARGVAFSDIIPALEAAGADGGLLVELRAIAPTGAPNLAKLQNMLYGGLLAASAPAGEGQAADNAGREDGWGWVRRTFGDSVKITRSDSSADSGTSQALEDIAEDARALLANGNITGAMAQLDKLEGAEHAAFADWRTAAARRLKLDETLIALRASMLELER